MGIGLVSDATQTQRADTDGLKRLIRRRAASFRGDAFLLDERSG